MIHTIQLGVASEAVAGLLGRAPRRQGLRERARRAARCAFADYDGLRFELVVADDGNPPLRAEHPEVPAEHAILGVEGARAYIAARPRRRPRAADRDARLHRGRRGRVPPRRRRAPLPLGLRRGDASAASRAPGTVHHIAWHSRDDDHVALAAARRRRPACSVTPVIDRDYFDAIYFRQPQGILFEIATTSPGFAVDEDPEHLGEELRLPAPARAPAPAARAAAAPRSTNPRAAQRAEAEPMSALTYRERPADGEPAGLLVLHHGRGADEHDLLGLADVLDPAAAPARRHAARAADDPRLAGLPLVRRAARRLPRPRHVPQRLRASSPRSTTSCGSAPASRPEHTVFGGFSMGSVMSYALGLGRRPPRPGRDPRLLGLRPGRRRLAARPRRRAPTCAVFIAHGRRDPIMEVGFARRARALLEAGGLPVELPRVRRRRTTSTRRTSRPRSTGSAGRSPSHRRRASGVRAAPSGSRPRTSPRTPPASTPGRRGAARRRGG